MLVQRELGTFAKKVRRAIQVSRLYQDRTKFFFTKSAITPRLETNFIKIEAIYVIIISNFLS